MILQGTDALSQGIWMSLFHGLTDTLSITQDIFAPLPYDPLLVQAYISAHGLHFDFTLYPLNSFWDARLCFD